MTDHPFRFQNIVRIFGCLDIIKISVMIGMIGDKMPSLCIHLDALKPASGSGTLADHKKRDLTHIRLLEVLEKQLAALRRLI
jgi:hypothetical protein